MRKFRFGRRRGATVVLAAIFMGVMFGMVAFAVDIGYITQVRTELQRVADACAQSRIHLAMLQNLDVRRLTGRLIAELGSRW